MKPGIVIALSTVAAVVLGGLLYRGAKGSSMTVVNKDTEDHNNYGRSGANPMWGGSRRNKKSNRRSKRIKR